MEAAVLCKILYFREAKLKKKKKKSMHPSNMWKKKNLIILQGRGVLEQEEKTKVVLDYGIIIFNGCVH